MHFPQDFRCDHEAVYALFSVSFRIQISGPYFPHELFSSLHTLPWPDTVSDPWNITVQAVNDFTPPSFCWGAKTNQMRIWPKTDIAFQEITDECLIVNVDHASATINSASKTIRLVFQSNYLRQAEVLCNFLILESMRHEGYFTLHAGAIEYMGGTILIFGSSGQGKSTISLALATLGCGRFMADDRCIIYRRYGKLWSGGVADSVGICNDTVSLLRKHNIHEMDEFRFRNDKTYINCSDFFLGVCRDAFPIKAMYFLDDHVNHDTENDSEIITACSCEDAFNRVWRSSFYPGPSHLSNAHFNILSDLVTCSPAYKIVGKSDLAEMVSAIEKVTRELPIAAYPIPPLSQLQRVKDKKTHLPDQITHLCALLVSVNIAEEVATLTEDEFRTMVRIADNVHLIAPLSFKLDAKRSDTDLKNFDLSVLSKTIQRHKQIRQIHLQQIVEISRLFNAAGYPWTLVNGPSIAERLYSDPAVHYYDKLEIIVEPGRVSETVHMLTAHGFQLDKHHPGPSLLDSDHEINLINHQSLYKLKLRHNSESPFMLKQIDTISVFGTPIAVVTKGNQFVETCLEEINSSVSSNMARMYAIYAMVENDFGPLTPDDEVKRHLPEIGRVLEQVGSFFPKTQKLVRLRKILEQIRST